jgi:hypothetical protein
MSEEAPEYGNLADMDKQNAQNANADILGYAQKTAKDIGNGPMDVLVGYWMGFRNAMIYNPVEDDLTIISTQGDGITDEIYLPPAEVALLRNALMNAECLNDPRLIEEDDGDFDPLNN